MGSRCLTGGAPPEVGWLYKEKLGLDALRRQLLETALQV